MQAVADVAVLESQGISSNFKGDTASDATSILTDSVELQVDDENYEAAVRLLTEAEKDRVDRYVSPSQRKKTPARYFKIALIAFFPLFAMIYLNMGELKGAVIAMTVLLAGGVAAGIGLVCAVFDI